MISHPKTVATLGAVHRRRPDGVVEFWNSSAEAWAVGEACRTCISSGAYPVVRFEDTWAEPVKEAE